MTRANSERILGEKLDRLRADRDAWRAKAAAAERRYEQAVEGAKLLQAIIDRQRAELAALRGEGEQ